MEIVVGFAIVLGFMGVGSWLESINGVNGVLDELLTPLPMGLGGIILMCLKGFSI
jgi:hypothetical protein